MERPDPCAIPCPVCQGTPLDHGHCDPHLNPPTIPAPVWDIARARPAMDYCIGGHDWRFDKWGLSGPVVWRCRICNAVADIASRDSWRRAVARNNANVPHAVRLRQLASGELAISPCDACGGSGAIHPAETARVLDAISRRARRASKRKLPRIGPLLRARDVAVTSTCPTCHKSDRSVPVIQTIGMSESEGDAWRLGEAVFDMCTGRTAHYCGRCDVEFGDSSVEFFAGLRY